MEKNTGTDEEYIVVSANFIEEPDTENRAVSHSLEETPAEPVEEPDITSGEIVVQCSFINRFDY